MNKKADSRGVPIEVVVFWILLIILLVVLISFYFYFPSFYDKIGGFMDSLLVMVGLRGGENVVKNNDCINKSISFDIGNSVVDEVVFQICFGYRGRQVCKILGFDDGAEYYYYPDNGEFFKKLKGTGYFDVNLGEKDEQALYSDKIFYNSVKFIYDAFGVPKESGRVFRYDIHNYLKYNIDDYFGRFGDLLIFYGDKSRYYFMAANGRYLIVDLNKMEDNGLGWIDEWFVDYEKDVNYRLITPLNGIFMTKDDGVIYAGDNSVKALNLLYQNSDGWFSDDVISYAICSPIDSNVVYENCKYTRNQNDVVDSGSFLDFKKKALKKLGSGYSIGAENSQLDNDVDFRLIKDYIERQQSMSFESGTAFSNPATKFNELIASKGMTGFEVDGKKFIVEARASEDSSFRYPVLRIRSEDNSEIYYLRFEGPELYRKGERDFFFSQGNQIKPPFLFYDKNMNEIKVSRRFVQTEEEDILDRKVYDFFVKNCA